MVSARPARSCVWIVALAIGRVHEWAGVTASPRIERPLASRSRRRGAGLGALSERALRLARAGAQDQSVDKEVLYEAYNKLHSLARAYRKPFDAPAVVVVGAQSSGKSALVEALMGFQFNEVGGGTRTRRPIALRMHYNAKYDEPKCYICDGSGETEATLQQVREYEIFFPASRRVERSDRLGATLGPRQRSYVEAENRRLERDAHRSFDPNPIVVRVEYRYCPNLVLIDTPGLIDGAGLHERDEVGTPKQRALRRTAREAYELVLSKCRAREHVLLCVDDNNDWNVGSIAREACETADPTMARTVIVNTKLDTKLVQFSSSRDVGSFLRARLLRELHPKLLAGPFFTTVPCGRVGKPAQSRRTPLPPKPERAEYDIDERTAAELDDATSSGYYDYLGDDGGGAQGNEEDDDDRDDAFDAFGEEFFADNGEYRAAAARATSADSSLIRTRLGQEAYDSVEPRIGVAALRSFLERHVERVYRTNVARVVPLLRNERTSTAKALAETQAELERLSPERLRRSAQTLADKFCKALSSAVAGTVSAPPEIFGEKLADERLNGGAFLAPAPPLEDEVLDSDFDDLYEDEDAGGGGGTRRGLWGFSRRGRPPAMPRGGEMPHTPLPPGRRRRPPFKEPTLVSTPSRNDPDAPAMELTLSQSALDRAVGHADSTLYGGAQYRRALREFAVAVRHLTLPTIRHSEIANALGVSDTHDGADLVRAACVIAIDKARRSFEPQLETLAIRVAHVMRRLPPVLDHILGVREPSNEEHHHRVLRKVANGPHGEPGAASPGGGGHASSDRSSLAPHARSMALVTEIYEKYVLELADKAMTRCRDDLEAMTRFVTWDLASSNADAAVRAALKPSPALEQLYPEEGAGAPTAEERIMDEWRSAASVAAASDDDEYGIEAATNDAITNGETDMVLTLISGARADSEETKNRVVGALVRRIAASWREHFAKTVAVKFNCYFLMPFVNDFPFELRERVDQVCALGQDEFFDVSMARKALETRRDELSEELTANSKLHETFDAIQKACMSSGADLSSEPSTMKSASNNINNMPNKAATDWAAAERAANTANSFSRP